MGSPKLALMPKHDDESFLAHVTTRLAALPCVEAVALGGSRATGTHGAHSDWDFAVYYRGAFSAESVRALGWSGEASEIGEWGGGVFNGGAWLQVDDRHVDVPGLRPQSPRPRCGRSAPANPSWPAGWPPCNGN
jgi:hypothetical protein